MNIPLISAAIITAATAIVHSVLGERLVLRKILQQPLPTLVGSEFLMRRTLRLAWHATTLAWLCIALVLINYARGPLDSAAVFTLHSVAVTFLISSVLSLLLAHGKHFSWAAFALIAALIWWGSL